MSKNRKLLGPLEAVNGVVMLGMTSAALMVILQQVIRDQRGETIALVPGVPVAMVTSPSCSCYGGCPSEAGLRGCGCQTCNPGPEASDGHA